MSCDARPAGVDAGHEPAAKPGALETLRAASRMVELEPGDPVHYLDLGGPPGAALLVCVHGLSGSCADWLAIAPALTGRYRVLALDLVGHGLTLRAGRPATIRGNQALLDRFLQAVAGAPAVLVGNSMGGLISLHQAAWAPRTVAGLVLIDPALPLIRVARPGLEDAARLALYGLPGLGEWYVRRMRRRVPPDQLVRRGLELVCVDPSRVPADVVAALTWVAEQRGGEPGLERPILQAGRSMGRALARRERVRLLLNRIAAPVLLLHGDADRLVPIAAARWAAQANPSWRLAVALDTGHVPMLERSAWTVELLDDWLDSEGAPAAAAARAAVPRRPPAPRLAPAEAPRFARQLFPTPDRHEPGEDP